MPRRGQYTARVRAATIRTPNILELDDFAVPQVAASGQLLVKMLRASVCGSDVHCLYHGMHNPDALGMPGHPGHEGVGEVVESRSERFPVGSRVLTVPQGNLGGCFAEYQLLDDAHVVALPDDADLDRVLFAQQYGTTLYAMRQMWPEAGNTGVSTGVVAIIGAGSAGLFFVQQALELGFEKVVVSDLHAERLDIARRLGATDVVHAPSASVVDAVMELSGGVGADLVIEAAGFDTCRADAIFAVRKFGTVGYFGFPERVGVAGFPANDAFRKVVRIQWTGGAQEEPGLVAFHDAVRHIHGGTVDVDYCLGTEYTLEDVPEALQRAADGGRGAVKITITIG